MQNKKLLLGLGVGLWHASFAAAVVQTPEQRADGSGQIPNSSPIAQEYYLGQIGIPSVTTGGIVGAVSPDKASVTWYKFVSDGVTPVIFDTYGTQMGSNFGGFSTSNDGALAVYDSQGNFIADNEGSNAPADGDSNVPPVIPSGAPNPPVKYRQPIDPTQSVYNYHGNNWFASNYNGLANLAFVKNPQSNPLSSTTPGANWNQYNVLPSGTYFIAVTGFSTYFAGDPLSQNSMNDPDNYPDVNWNTPFGFVTYHAESGTYQLNVRVAGDMDLNGTPGFSDLRLLRLQSAQYFSTAGIPSSGFSGATWIGLPNNPGNPLTDLQGYDLTGNQRIDTYDIAAWGRYTAQSTVVSMTWNNSPTSGGDPYNPGSAGNGTTWDLETNQNFHDSIGTDAFFNGDLITFNDSNNGHYAVSLPGTVAPGSLTFNNSSGDYSVTGAGAISGSTSLLKTGTRKLTLSTVNNYSGGTTVSGGTLELTVTGALPLNSALTIGSNATVVAVNHGANPKVVLQTSSLSIAGATNAWTGKLDLANNDLVAHTGDITTIANQLKKGFNAGHWNGSGGIVSSTAGGDTRFLTTLGYRAGDGSVFDGVNTTASDVLVKYTYYGDADLNGSVSGADYALIDTGFGMHLTGWANGDFNYDGVVNGTDYSLIDNTFNQIKATNAGSLAIIASPSSLVAGSAVPEPTTLGLLAAGAIGLMSRRRRGM